tara:strand:- start:5985 stop:6758 length:774 start_codon:yes stop_codon:yes gene_type:complete
MAFLKYEDVVIELGNESIFADSASINVDASVVESRNVYGEIERYAPTNGLRGELGFEYYMTGAIPAYLDMTGIPDSQTSDGSFAGLDFSNAYTRSYSLEVQPYSPVKINASLDFYSALTTSIATDSTSPTSLPYWKNQYAHGIRSYVLGAPSNINNTLSVSYGITATRNPVYLAGQTSPTRVTKEAVEVNMTLRGDNIGEFLLVSGRHAEITCHMLDMNTNTTLDKLRCSGQIVQQELSISPQNYLNGVISVRQVFQ